MLVRNPGAPELLVPSSRGFIVLTLVVGLTLNLLPWSPQMLVARPDFVSLALLYWCIREPRKVGVGTAWVMGLMMDVADGVLLGQYALSYAFTVFIALVLHRRILLFNVRQQTIYVFLLLLLLQTLMLLIRLMSGADFIGPVYFLASLLGALSWPALVFLMQWPQRHRAARDGA